MTPWAPKPACPVCRRADCTDPQHRVAWRRQRQARPMTNAEIEHCRRAVAEWVEAHGSVCAVCGKVTDDLTADHLTPVSSGGDPLGPVRVVCRSCNSRRGNRPLP